MALVINRKISESIDIYNAQGEKIITLTISKVHKSSKVGGSVKLAIEGLKEFRIVRSEIPVFTGDVDNVSSC